MRRVEIATSLRYGHLAFRRPNWWFALLRNGRVGLLREVVRDSLEVLRSEPRRGLNESLETPPTTPLGRMGAPQEYLYRIVRATKPLTVVETGVYRGVSTAMILAALHENRKGQLISIDLPSGSYRDSLTGKVDSSPLSPGEQVGFAIPENLRDRWSLHIGDVRRELPLLLGEHPTIDMFYHDSEHTYELMTWEFEQVVSHIRAGGLITSDDTNWNSAFADFTFHHKLTNVRTILSRLGVATIPPTV
jgi:predicted O-methyltransferase YrrM